MNEDLRINEPKLAKEPQYYAGTDEAGTLVAFYVDCIHPKIPETAQPISQEDWRLYISNGPHLYKWDGEAIREKTQEELEAEYVEPTPLPPSEIDMLREENQELKLALAELAEELEADKTDMQLALAELASLLDGGA